MDAFSDRTRRALVVDEALASLARTPRVLQAMLRDLPADWASANEGPNTWSALDVVAHLIHTDRTNWVVRARTILQHGEATPFPVFERFGHLTMPPDRPLEIVLDEFAATRGESLAEIGHLRQADVDRRGRHPDLGPVTLGQLLSAWVVHDHDHVMQISRVLARQYTDAVGPWRGYLRIVRDIPR
jgi:hypothetical protein